MDQKTKEKLKKEIEELKKLPGEQRGEHIKYYIDHVKKQEGEKGFNRLKKFLKEEVDFDISDAKEKADMEMIPETYAHVFFVAAARFFNWSEKEIFELGKTISSVSPTMKIFIRHFLSFEKTAKESVKVWNKNFTRGKMELKSFDEKNRKFVMALKNFKTHPFACIHFQGAIAKMTEIATGSDQVKIKEVKCMSRGDDHHEYHVEW